MVIKQIEAELNLSYYGTKSDFFLNHFFSLTNNVKKYRNKKVK